MKCSLCDWEQPDAEVGLEGAIDHIRVMHPDDYGDGPDRWPDGSLAIHDTTLEPSDFIGGEPPC